jgi:hypothetical protein
MIDSLFWTGDLGLGSEDGSADGFTQVEAR